MSEVPSMIENGKQLIQGKMAFQWLKNKLSNNIDGAQGLNQISGAGNLDYASLDGYEETQYRTWSQLNLNLTATNFRAGHEGLDRGVDSRIKAQLAIRWSQRPGQAAYYEKYGRSHTYDPALRTILDEVFLETQGRVIQS